MSFFSSSSHFATPDDLGHVPASAGEQTFQLVDDLVVADNRTIQTLQVAVDHKTRLSSFSRTATVRAPFGFRLVHLAVTQEGVNGLLGAILDATVGQVLQETRLIDGGDGAQTMETVGNCQNSGISFGCG